MPQPPTPNMLLVQPSELGDSGAWASILTTLFQRIDAHDHTSNFGVKVPLATGVTIGADIPWTSGGVFYAITRLKALDFEPQASGGMSTYFGALFMNSSDNELYWRSSGGALVKFTNGANFNFAAIGAIGGDYVSAAALFDYVDASGTYRARQEIAAGAQQWAIVQTGGVDLYEFKLHPAVGVPGNQIRLRSPAALAAPYTMTWPGAVPGAAGTLVQIDNTGQLSFANTGLQAVTLASNQNLTLSGTGDVKHGTRTRTLTAAGFVVVGTSPTYLFNAGNAASASASGTAQWGTSVPLRTGDRITAIRVYVQDNVTGPTKLQVTLRTWTWPNTAVSDIATSSASTGAGTAQTIQITGLTTTVTAGSAYLVAVSMSTGSATCSVFGAEIDYDHP